MSIAVLTRFQTSRCNTTPELQVIIYATYGAIVRYSRVNEVQFLQPLTVQVEKQGSIIMISRGDACQSRGEENLWRSSPRKITYYTYYTFSDIQVLSQCSRKQQEYIYMHCAQTHMYWFATYYIIISVFFNTWGYNGFSLDGQSRGR